MPDHRKWFSLPTSAPGGSRGQERAVCDGSRCSERSRWNTAVSAGAGLELRPRTARAQPQEQSGAASLHRRLQHGTCTGNTHTHAHAHLYRKINNYMISSWVFSVRISSVFFLPNLCRKSFIARVCCYVIKHFDFGYVLECVLISSAYQEVFQ